MPNASPVIHTVHLPCVTLRTLCVAPEKIAVLTLLMSAYVVLLHAVTRAIAEIKSPSHSRGCDFHSPSHQMLKRLRDASVLDEGSLR